MRDRQLDAVRAVAVLAMFVAHFAPSGGPGGVLDISEYVAAPLFAFVIGWGASIGSARPGRAGQVRSVVVRGAALLVLGLWLGTRISQIYVILPWLGVMVLALAVLIRLRSRWLLVVGLVLFAVEPTLLARGQDWLLGLPDLERTPIGLVAPTLDQVGPLAVELLAAGGPYRVTWLLPLALLGVLVERHATSGTAAIVLAQVGWIVSVLLLGAGDANLVRLDPYSGRYAVMVLDAALVVAIGLTAYWLATWVPRLAALLAPCGAMALSVYVAQLVASEVWVRRVAAPDAVTGVATDNSWTLLVLMLVAGLLLPLAWEAVLGRTPLARGPLEAPLAVLSGSRLSSRPARRTQRRASGRRTTRRS